MACEGHYPSQEVFDATDPESWPIFVSRNFLEKRRIGSGHIIGCVASFMLIW